jgi:hypothetical protein
VVRKDDTVSKRTDVLSNQAMSARGLKRWEEAVGGIAMGLLSQNRLMDAKSNQLFLSRLSDAKSR